MEGTKYGEGVEKVGKPCLVLVFQLGRGIATVKLVLGARGVFLTFVDILLNAYMELPLTSERHRCMVHPVRTQDMLFNEITDYCADFVLSRVSASFICSTGQMRFAPGLKSLLPRKNSASAPGPTCEPVTGS